MKQFFKKNIELYEICAFLIALPFTWMFLMPICEKFGLNYQYTQAVEFAVSLFVLLLFTKIVFENHSFILKKYDFKHPVIKYGWLGFVGAIGAFMSAGSAVDLHPTVTIFIGYILMNLMIAITEEVVFRKVFIGLFINKNNLTKRRLWYAIFFSSVIFGLRHMFNLMSYSNQIVTCSFQVLSTACAAIYLTGIYLVTGSLIPGIIIHFLEDMGVTSMEMFSSKALENSMQDIKVLEGAGMVLIQIPYVICGIIMIRKYIQKMEKENSE